MEKGKKLKRTLGFPAAYGAAVGLVVSGSAMFSVGNVGSVAGNATWIAALIALVPMMAAAFAFGELASMLPGGGMISEYTAPALGKFAGAFALLSGYVVLITCDGGTQLTMGGESVEQLVGIPSIAVTVALAVGVVLINVFGVGMYGKLEAGATIVMMLLFAGLAIAGFAGVGEAGGAEPINAGMGLLPDGGWGAVLGTVGTAIWFFIGFEFACPMAEESRKPYRSIPWALIIGLLTIFVIDSVFSAASVRYTDLAVLGSSAIPHVEAARAMLGTTGFVLMTVLTILAAFTTANSYCAALPRMLYGMAREGLVPKAFGHISSKTRTPILGTLVTGGLMAITIVYIHLNGANSSTVSSLISVATITWVISYAIAMIDVLVLRHRYPDFPRLWKAPAAKITLPIGIAGVVFAISTLTDYLPAALVCMAIVAAYCFFWMRAKKIPMFKPTPIAEVATEIRERSEYLPGWDEEVAAWIAKRRTASTTGTSGGQPVPARPATAPVGA